MKPIKIDEEMELMNSNFYEAMELHAFSERRLKAMNPLVLAYVGDCVYELYIRTYLAGCDYMSAHEMNRHAIRLVCAAGQAKMVHALKTELTEEEWAVVKWGRNQKPSTVPKRARVSDYRYATGLEALAGYLYLTGQEARLNALMIRGISQLESEAEDA